MKIFSSKGTNSRMAGSTNDKFEREKSIGGTLSSMSKDTAKTVGESFADIGKGIFNDLLGLNNEASKTPEQQYIQAQQENAEKGKIKAERGNIFSQRNIEEERMMQQIKELIDQIKKEVQHIKEADRSLLAEVKDIEKLSIESTVSEKPGIYHIRFLEIVLKLLQTVKMKISESGTWLEAMQTKKAKRGSLFASRAKQKGTQYSMSQELSKARAVQ